MTCGHNRALGAWLQGSRAQIMVGGAPFVEGPQPSLDKGMSLNGLKGLNNDLNFSLGT